MESKWRYNVYALGLADLGIRVCSRRVPAFLEAVTDLDQTCGPNAFVQYTLPDTADAFYPVPICRPKLAPHFPYGYRVEPDGPV